MDERLQFVARRLAGEAMSELCQEFGISRKTGYKIFDRYQECGIQGLTNRSRRPNRYANQLPFQVAIDSSIDHGTHSRFTLAGWPSIGVRLVVQVHPGMPFKIEGHPKRFFGCATRRPLKWLLWLWYWGAHGPAHTYRALECVDEPWNHVSWPLWYRSIWKHSMRRRLHRNFK